MSRKEAMDQYAAALRSGKNYYKLAVSRGEYPYPTVLDNIINPDDIIDRVSLGVINIPTELIAGTKTEGRVSALAGNFMPLLGEDTEFATKWTDLCEAHLSDEGIRPFLRTGRQQTGQCAYELRSTIHSGLCHQTDAGLYGQCSRTALL